jgi:hypothetical protein
MKMICTQCGRIVGVSPKIFKARVEKYGDEETLLKTYVCRQCKGGAPGQPGLIKRQLEALGWDEDKLKQLREKSGVLELPAPVRKPRVKKVEAD